MSCIRFQEKLPNNQPEFVYKCPNFKCDFLNNCNTRFLLRTATHVFLYKYTNVYIQCNYYGENVNIWAGN